MSLKISNNADCLLITEMELRRWRSNFPNLFWSAPSRHLTALKAVFKTVNHSLMGINEALQLTQCSYLSVAVKKKIQWSSGDVFLHFGTVSVSTN